MLKFMRISTDYPEYIDYLYGRDPALAQASYAVQEAALAREGFFWHGHWTRLFPAFGYAVWEVAWNNPHIQAAWAREHGLPGLEATRLRREDLEALCLWQAREYQPDVVWLHHWSLPFLQHLRQEVPSVRLVFGWVGSAVPAANMDFFRSVDLLFTCAPESLEQLARVRDGVHLMPHWYSPLAGEALEPREKRYDVSFIGGLRSGSAMHQERIAMLGAIAQQCDLAVFSSEATDNPAVEAVRQPGIYGLAMLQALQDSRIVLNIHADSSPVFASNLRLYEATGVGSCLLTDWRANLRTLFDPGTEVATFATPEECLAQIRRLLDDAATRTAMAQAGQRRCLRDHTFAERLTRFDHLIRKRLAPPAVAVPASPESAPEPASEPAPAPQDPAAFRLPPPLPGPIMQLQFESLRQALGNDRFTQRRISFLGYDLTIVDGRSVVYQFKDIFVDQIYRFDAGTPAPRILDCGANVGLSCLYFKRLYPQAKIVAFEADRKIVRHLEANLAKNGAADVRVLHKACWVHDQGVHFAADGADGGHIAQAGGHPEQAAIPSVRLRDVIARMPSVSLLKMDIEGAETEVLLDCRDVLSRVEHLFFEFHSREREPQRLGELLTLLQDVGYRYCIQDIAPRPSPFINRTLYAGFDMQLNVFAYR